MTRLNYLTGQTHGGPVSAVALRGDAIYSAAYDGCLGLWAMKSPKPVLEKMLYLHDKGVNCVSASPVGPELATGGSDGTACIIKPGSKNARVWRCSHPGDVECAVFNADGRLLMTGGTDGFGRIFEVKTGNEVSAIHHGATVGAACRHPNPAFFVTGCNDRRLRLIRWEDGAVIAVSQAHSGPVKALAVCKLGILSAGHDQRLLLHDLDLKNSCELMRFSTTPKSMAAESDSNSVWIGIYDQRLDRYICSGDQISLDFETHSPRFWAHGLAAGHNCAVIGSFDGAPIICSCVSNQKAPTRDPYTVVPCISTSTLDSSGSILVAGDSGYIRCVKPPSHDGGVIVTSMEGAITSMVGTHHDLLVSTWDGVVARLSRTGEIWRAAWPASGGSDRRAPSPVLRVARNAGRVLAGLYTGGWACFRESDGSLLWHQTEATGAIKCVDLRDDVYAVTGRYDPLRVGEASKGTVQARLSLSTPVSDVVAISPFLPTDQARIAVCAGANEIWIVDLYRNRGQWDLRVIHRSGGHLLPVKALLWLSEDAVLAGDYHGSVIEHRLNRPSRFVDRANCRLGISSLALGLGGQIFYTTFDGKTEQLNNIQSRELHAA